jgi:hypothetical protein
MTENKTIVNSVTTSPSKSNSNVKTIGFTVSNALANPPGTEIALITRKPIAYNRSDSSGSTPKNVPNCFAAIVPSPSIELTIDQPQNHPSRKIQHSCAKRRSIETSCMLTAHQSNLVCVDAISIAGSINGSINGF